MVTIWRMWHQQHINSSTAAAVHSKRADLHSCTHDHCSTFLKEIVSLLQKSSSAASEIFIYNTNSEQLNRNWHNLAWFEVNSTQPQRALLKGYSGSTIYEETKKCVRIAWLIYQGAEQPLVSATLSLSLSRPLSLICVKRPAVSNHSLSVTLNLICKCDTWGQSPVLRVCPATTHAPLRLVRALHR